MSPFLMYRLAFKTIFLNLFLEILDLTLILLFFIFLTLFGCLKLKV